MGAAAYNRGSRLVWRNGDAKMPKAVALASMHAVNDELSELRSRVGMLESELRRARRCLAAERAAREALRIQLADEQRSNAFGVSILCKLAFPSIDAGKEGGA